MPISNTQEVYEVRSISPSYINPSIMEGRTLYTSILGPDRAVEIVRYAPVFLTAPLLTGDPGIPSRLYCSAGVVDASPSAYRQYVWKADGVTIPGVGGFNPGADYFDTDASFDAQEITCTVTAINILGNAVSTSNGITVTLIEDIEVNEFDTYQITGIDVQDAVTTASLNMGIITGMAAEDNQTLFSYDSMLITGVSVQDHVTIPAYDTYAMVFPVLHSTITTLNAESGVGDWTMVQRSIITDTVGGSVSGTRYYRPTYDIGGYDDPVIAYNAVAIPVPRHALVDAGNALIGVLAYVNSTTGNVISTEMKLYIRAVDGSGVETPLEYEGWFEPYYRDNSGPGEDTWHLYTKYPLSIPANTRTIRVYLEFAGAISGNTCRVDDITVQIWSTP